VCDEAQLYERICDIGALGCIRSAGRVNVRSGELAQPAMPVMHDLLIIHEVRLTIRASAFKQSLSLRRYKLLCCSSSHLKIIFEALPSVRYYSINNRVAAGIPYFVHFEYMFYYRVHTHGSTALPRG
jgi:hypothetical protein